MCRHVHTREAQKHRQRHHSTLTSIAGAPTPIVCDADALTLVPSPPDNRHEGRGVCRAHPSRIDRNIVSYLVGYVGPIHFDPSARYRFHQEFPQLPGPESGLSREVAFGASPRGRWPGVHDASPYRGARAL
jgi:hypothetical protein